MKRLVLFSAIALLMCSCGSSHYISSNANDEQNFGYGKEKRANSVYNIPKVETNESDIASYPTIGAYLRGRVAGVDVSGSDDNPTIRIRGERSLIGSNDPLIFVDGVEVRDLSSVSTQDVISIDVLKDSATSLYGARGADGVILITTSRAKAQ